VDPQYKWLLAYGHNELQYFDVNYHHNAGLSVIHSIWNVVTITLKH
jgi:hypothetical protein